MQSFLSERQYKQGVQRDVPPGQPAVAGGSTGCCVQEAQPAALLPVLLPALWVLLEFGGDLGLVNPAFRSADSSEERVAGKQWRPSASIYPHSTLHSELSFPARERHRAEAGKGPHPVTPGSFVASR